PAHRRLAAQQGEIVVGDALLEHGGAGQIDITWLHGTHSPRAAARQGKRGSGSYQEVIPISNTFHNGATKPIRVAEVVRKTKRRRPDLPLRGRRSGAGRRARRVAAPYCIGEADPVRRR